MDSIESYKLQIKEEDPMDISDDDSVEFLDDEQNDTIEITDDDSVEFVKTESNNVQNPDNQNQLLSHPQSTVTSKTKEFLVVNNEKVEKFVVAENLKIGFQCGFCDQQFRMIELLDYHISLNHNKFKCSLCEKSFRFKKSLNQHIFEFHGDNCGICEERFSSKMLLERHKYEKHHVQCRTCLKYVLTEEALTAHVARVHPLDNSIDNQALSSKAAASNAYAPSTYPKIDITPKEDQANKILSHSTNPDKGEEQYVTSINDNNSLKCLRCLEIFPTKVALQEHTYSQHMIQCEFCGCSFWYKDSLMKHISRVHYMIPEPDYNVTKVVHEIPLRKENYNQGPLQCEICEKWFKSFKSFKNHKLTKHESKCYMCQGRYPKKEDLIKHMRADHNMFCDLCDKVFLRKSYLQRHINHTHMLTCYQCCEQFDCSRALNAHVNEAHLNATIKNCNICDKTFYTKRSLESHIQSKHSEACDQCKEVFINRELLAKHLETVHSIKDRFVECHICNKYFLNEDHRKRHQRYKHPSSLILLEITCGICDEKFIGNMRFIKHCKEFHTGMKCKYKCGQCEKVLPSLFLYSQHNKQNHGKDGISKTSEKEDEVSQEEEDSEDEPLIKLRHLLGEKHDGDYVQQGETGVIEDPIDIEIMESAMKVVVKNEVIDLKCDNCEMVFNSIDELQDHCHDVDELV